MFVCFARDAAMRAYPSQVSSLLTYFTRHGGGLVCLVARTAGLTLVGASLFASELQLLELLRATRPLLSTLRFNFSRELLCFSALLFSFASALLFSFAFQLCFSALLFSFAFQLCFSFAFQLCFSALLFSFAFQLCFSALLFSFAFQLCFSALLQLYWKLFCCSEFASRPSGRFPPGQGGPPAFLQLYWSSACGRIVLHTGQVPLLDHP